MTWPSSCCRRCISSAWEATCSRADEAFARADAASVRAAAASDFSSSQSNRRSATSAPCWERRAVAPASEDLRDRSEPQTSTSRRMNDDLAALRSVRSWGKETGCHDERLAHRKEKVCLKPLPGGFWGRPCRKPPATTGAIPPLLQHTREAHPRTGPPVHRRERRRGPRPRGSGIGATGAGPQGSAAQR